MLPHAPKITSSLEPLDISELREEAELKNVSILDSNVDTPVAAKNIDISIATFSNVDLYQSRLNKFRAEDFIASSCDFSVANFSNSTFMRTELNFTRLTGTNFTECSFQDVVLTSCKLDMTTLRYAKFKRVIFRDCELTEADFSGSSFEHVVFDNCTLDKVRFDQARVKSLDLTTSTIIEIYGWASLKNTLINPVQLIEISPYLAQELGLKINSDETDN